MAKPALASKKKGWTGEPDANKFKGLVMHALAQMLPDEIRQQYPRGDFDWQYDVLSNQTAYSFRITHTSGKGAECRVCVPAADEMDPARLAWHAHGVAAALADQLRQITPFGTPDVMKHVPKEPPKPKHWCKKCGPVDKRYPEWGPCKHEAAA